jgi:hypothetical protein
MLIGIFMLIFVGRAKEALAPLKPLQEINAVKTLKKDFSLGILRH